MVFRMSKINARVTILFLILISLFYSCTKRSTKPRPQELKLYLSLDLYGGGVIDGKQYVSVSYENEVVKYSEKDFVENGYVVIPKGKDVTIELFPNIPEDDTFIGTGGDASDNLGGEAGRYDFKMDSNKLFEITISSTEIPIYEFKFESGNNGQIAVSKIDKYGISAENVIIESGTDNIQTIEMTKLMLDNYDVKARAIPDTNCILSSWDISHDSTINTIYDEEITINTDTITTVGTYLFNVKFEEEEFISINFEAGEGGNITITTEKDGVPIDINTILIEAGNTQDVKISSSKFKPGYVLKASTTVLENHQFDRWDSEYTLPAAKARSTSAVHEFIIKEDMDGKAFKAYFISVSTSAITFDPTEGGKIEVSVFRKIDNVYLEKRSITSTSEAVIKTLNISDTWFEAGYTIIATTTKSENYDFENWSSDGVVIPDTAGKITLDSASKGKTYKANFKEKMFTFNFTAINGTVKIYTKANTSGSIRKLFKTIPTDGNSLEIGANSFDTNTIEAEANGDSDHVFKEWTSGVKEGDRLKQTIGITKEMSSDTITASFIEEVTFTFKAPNGSIKVYKELNEYPYTKNEIVLNSGSFTLMKSDFAKNTITAEAKANIYYKLKDWSVGENIGLGVGSSLLTIRADMNGKIITVNFVEEELNFTFKAGANGSIKVYKGANEVTLNSGGSLKITKSEFAKTKITVIPMPADAKYKLKDWNVGGGAGVKGIPLEITEAMDTKTITANFTTDLAPIPVNEWYEIYVKEELIYVSSVIATNSSSPYVSYKYKIMNDIDYGGATHTAIRTFKGIMNGNNKAIKNANFAISYSYGGFFGSTTGATISNLIIDSSVTIKAEGYVSVGSIAGYIENSTIQNCVNKADININSTSQSLSAGGIVAISSGSTILNVYNKGRVTIINNYSSDGASCRVGGIVSHLSSGNSITNAYNTGYLEARIPNSRNSARIYIGGICGSIGSSAPIENAYSIGGVYGSISWVDYRPNVVYAGGIYTASGASIKNNVYFVPSGGLSLRLSGDYDSDSPDRTVATAGGWSAVLTAFTSTTSGSGVWIAGPNGGRPIIKGLPAEY